MENKGASPSSEFLPAAPYFSSAFGLRLRTTHPVPGLPPLRDLSKVDVDLCLGSMPDWWEALPKAEPEAQPWYVSPEQDQGDRPSLTVWTLRGGSYFRLLYDDGTEFLIDRAGERVWATWPEPWGLERVALYLCGPILGFVQRLRNVTCLHASAVAVENQAIALVGPVGAGKSVTAAMFAKLGYAVLSDDIVALRDQGDSFQVRLGFPRLCLWPEAVNLLSGSPDALPLLMKGWNKRYLPLGDNGYRFQQEPLNLAAVYILGERSEDPRAPFVEALSGSAALVDLAANTYMTGLLDSTMRAREFESLGRVIARVPVRRLRPSADLSHLERLCETVLADFHSFIRLRLGGVTQVLPIDSP